MWPLCGRSSFTGRLYLGDTCIWQGSQWETDTKKNTFFTMILDDVLKIYTHSSMFDIEHHHDWERGPTRPQVLTLASCIIVASQQLQWPQFMKTWTDDLCDASESNVSAEVQEVPTKKATHTHTPRCSEIRASDLVINVFLLLIMCDRLQHLRLESLSSELARLSRLVSTTSARS
jgi:hypothetical protein